MRLFRGLRVTCFIGHAHELAPEIPQTDDDWRRRLVAEVLGDGRMRLFDVADERRRLPWSVHLDGGGALSGGSNWSKAIAAAPANAFTNMRPSPATRLAATR